MIYQPFISKNIKFHGNSTMVIVPLYQAYDKVSHGFFPSSQPLPIWKSARNPFRSGLAELEFRDVQAPEHGGMEI